MKGLFLLSCLFVPAHRGFCQGVIDVSRDACARILVIDNDEYNFPYSYDTFLANSIDSLSVGNVQVVDSPNEYTPLSLQAYLTDYLIFSGPMDDTGRLAVELKLTNRKISDEILNQQLLYRVIMFLEDVSEYGVVDLEKDTSYQCFEWIRVRLNDKLIEIPSDLFYDLVNPNVVSRYQSYRPIEAYVNEKDKYVSIYIMGEMPIWIIDDEFNFSYAGISQSYVAKIQVNVDGSASRIVIGGQVLSSYGWVRCPTFWPF